MQSVAPELSWPIILTGTTVASVALPMFIRRLVGTLVILMAHVFFPISYKGFNLYWRSYLNRLKGPSFYSNGERQVFVYCFDNPCTVLECSGHIQQCKLFV